MFDEEKPAPNKWQRHRQCEPKESAGIDCRLGRDHPAPWLGQIIRKRQATDLGGRISRVEQLHPSGTIRERGDFVQAKLRLGFAGGIRLRLDRELQPKHHIAAAAARLMHLDRESVFAGVDPFRIERERVAPGVSAVGRESFKINLAIGRHPKSFPELFAVQVKNRTIIDVVCDPDQSRLNVLRNLESRPEIIGDLALLIIHRRAQRHLQTIVLVAQQPGAAAPFRIVEIDSKPVTSRGVAGIFKSPFVIQR